MDDNEDIKEKLDEVKEAIKNINIPDNFNQLKEVNNSLKNIAFELRELRVRLK